MKWANQVLLHERGVETVNWLMMALLMLVLVGGVWAALSGAPGRALRQAVQDEVALYANSFEGGLSTSGPGAAHPQGWGRISATDSGALMP